MLNKIEIKNFRCFKHLMEGHLKRFNIVVGEGGSGKTAFLESIFLAGGGSPEIYLRLRGWRGFGDIRLTGTRDSFESLFSDLFFNFDQKRGALISLDDSAVGERTLRIYYDIDEPMSLPLKGRLSDSGTFFIHPLHFHWKTSHKTVDSKIFLEENVLKISGTQDVYPIYMISPHTISISMNAQRFSELSKANRQGPVVKAVADLYPNVKDITLETVAGEVMLYASFDGLQHKLPIAVLSAGMNKYLAIVLAIIANPGGVVLIDEMENGFYYKTLTAMLTSIVTLCEEYNVQLIASTHSYEFLQSMAPVIENGREEMFSLIRVARSGNESNVKYIRGSSFRNAIEQGLELR